MAGDIGYRWMAMRTPQPWRSAALARAKSQRVVYEVAVLAST